jgi:hypothetical protein
MAEPHQQPDPRQTPPAADAQPSPTTTTNAPAAARHDLGHAEAMEEMRLAQREAAYRRMRRRR